MSITVVFTCVIILEGFLKSEMTQDLNEFDFYNFFVPLNFGEAFAIHYRESSL